MLCTLLPAWQGRREMDSVRPCFNSRMPAYTNISAYKFTTLTDLKSLRERLHALCKRMHLKGTILLSTEGINLFVAGPPGAVESLVAELRTLRGLEDLSPKHSPGEHQPFS